MISFEVDTRDLDRLQLRLRGLRTQIQNPAGIMRTVAEGVEHQTKVRLHFEKRAPDGTPWAPWSARYARTRTAAHSLLQDTRAMSDDLLDSSSTARTARVFNTAPYAGVHQGGSRRTPARPFLGLSAQNVRDMEGWLAPALENLAQDALRGR